MNQTPITLHAISVADLDAVVALHCASWRSAYRGILSDAYLDGDLLTDRLEVWHLKLSMMTDRQFGWLAKHAGEPVGFVFASIDHDPTWGTLVDNLHVLPSHHGAGIGRGLLMAVAHFARERAKANATHAGLFLWCLEQNIRARAFYEHLGAEAVERIVSTAADGQSHPKWRCAWRIMPFAP
jgi:GNAT superfamily N-acetyltransferase